MTRIVKDPEDRRNEILDAAKELFEKKGYDKTTVNDILEKIGIAKGTFYYYFKSKEEVMDAIVMRFIQIGVEAAESIAVDKNIKAFEKLYKIIAGQNLLTEQNEDILDHLHQVKNTQMHQKSNVETILQIAPIFADVIRQGISEGIFEIPYPQETIEFLLVASQFLFDRTIFHWTPEEIMSKAKAFAFIIESLLKAEKGSFDYVPKLYEKMLSEEVSK